MKGKFNRFLWLAMAWACHGTALGQQAQRRESGERGGPPFEMVRSIETMQDQVVLGKADAQLKLPQLMGQIADRLLAADPVVWREARNDRALVIYTLSGGQPRVVRKVLLLNLAPEPEAALMAASLAYVEGQEETARRTLLAIDARTLAASLGGYVALAQSALTARADPRRALGFLDVARILAPGSLVEEAALRRSVLLAAEISDFRRFAAASSEYLRRYQKSLYAGQFRRRFSESLAPFGLTSDMGERGRLVNLLNELDASEQLSLYLLIAQAGILKGKIEPARFAAGQAMRLSQETGLEGARAKLYQAATTVLTLSPEAGLRELADVDASRLTKRDADLKDLISTMAGQIQKSGGDAESSSGVEPKEAHAAPQAEEGGRSPSLLIESARMALSQADALLKGRAP